MDIGGSVALVTGAASGLGEASARELHARGAHVVLADVDAGRGEEVARELGERAGFVRCDVTSEDDVQRAVAEAAGRGRFAVCVHCAGAGIAARTVARDGTPHALDAFRQVVELNLVGTFNVLRLAAAAMARNEADGDGGRGVCVLTASIAAFEGQVGQVAYGSAKAGVVGMTLIGARDLAAIGVRVCTIAPGTFGTPPMMGVPEPMRDALVTHALFPKRVGEPAEYAALAAHIVENDYLNGEVIRLDAGARFQPR